MRLVRLRLDNIFQHEKLDWEFGSGLIGVYGPNGRGKSNAMLVAPYIALTGKYDRVVGGKAGVIRRGTTEGVIRLDISCKGQPLHLRLDFAAKKDDADVTYELKYTEDGEERKIKGNKQVYEELRVKFGIDAAVLGRYVLVQQKSLIDLIADDPAERIKALGRLCGTEHAEDVWKACGDQATLLRNTLQSLSISEDDTEELLRVARKNARKAKQRWKTVAAACLSADARKKLDDTVAARKLRRDAKAKLAELEERHKQLTGDQAELSLQHNQNLELLTKYRKVYRRRHQACVAARLELEELRQRRTDYNDYHALLASITSKAALIDTPTPTRLQSPDWGDEAAAKETLRTLEGEIRDAKNLLAVAGKPKCPMCQTEVDTLGKRIAAAKKQLPQLEDQQRRLNTFLSQCEDRREEISKVQTRKEAAAEQLETLRTRLEKLPKEKRVKKRPPKSAELLKTFRELLGTFRKAKKNYTDVKSLDSKLTKSVSENFGAVKAAAMEIERAKKTIPPHVTKQAVLQARQRVSRDDQRRARASELQTKYEVARALRKQAQETNERAAAQRERRRLMLLWAERLERYRGLMHRKGLPQTVHTAALGLLEAKINPLLTELDVPFSVLVDGEDANLIARMDDGEDFPAQALSGGLTVSLALTYRLSVKETFAEHFDTLVLDEPTSWLDSRRMDCLVDMLIRVRRRARKLGQQIIIVSHSDRLRRVFDTILKVA